MPLRRDSAAPQTDIEVLFDRIEKLTKRVTKIAQRTTTTIQAIKKEEYPLDPVQGEVQWHYPWQRGYVWHNHEWRPLMPPTYHIKVYRDHKPNKVDPEAFIFAVSRDMDGFYLMDIEIYVTAPGTCTVMMTNRTAAVDMLLTPISTVGSNSGLTEAQTTAIIDPVNSQVSWQDEIVIDVQAAGGEGLGVILVFDPHDETHA